MVLGGKGNYGFGLGFGIFDKGLRPLGRLGFKVGFSPFRVLGFWDWVLGVLRFWVSYLVESKR